MVKWILNRITLKLGFCVMADNRRLQNVLLRSSAINSVFEMVWKAKICDRNVNYNSNSAPWFNAPVFGCRIISLYTCIQTLHTWIHTCIQTIADRKTFCCDRLQAIVFLNVKTTACGRHLKWLKRQIKFACSKSYFSVSAIGCSIRIWVAYGDLSASKFHLFYYVMYQKIKAV